MPDLSTKRKVLNWFDSLESKESKKALPYVYVAVSSRGEFYIGFRSANKKPAQYDFYWSSSALVKARRKDFHFKALKIFRSHHRAFKYEQALIAEHLGNPLCLNKHCHSKGTYNVSGVPRPDQSLRMLTDNPMHRPEVAAKFRRKRPEQADVMRRVSALKILPRVNVSFVCKLCRKTFYKEFTITKAPVEKLRERCCSKSCATKFRYESLQMKQTSAWLPEKAKRG